MVSLSHSPTAGTLHLVSWICEVPISSVGTCLPSLTSDTNVPVLSSRMFVGVFTSYGLATLSCAILWPVTTEVLARFYSADRYRLCSSMRYLRQLVLCGRIQRWVIQRKRTFILLIIRCSWSAVFLEVYTGQIKFAEIGS